jgi:hypothetical protein
MEEPHTGNEFEEEEEELIFFSFLSHGPMFVCESSSPIYDLLRLFPLSLNLSHFSAIKKQIKSKKISFPKKAFQL